MAGGLVTSLRLGGNSSNPEARRSFLRGLWRLCTPSLVCQGREPPDAMSLRFVDTSLKDLLGRPSLLHAVRASAIL